MYGMKKKFDREQLVFIIEVALCSAFDKVFGALPTGCSTVGGADYKRWLEDQDELNEFIHGAVSHVGIFIPILWAQTEGKRIGDGMGEGEFYGWGIFEKMVDEFIQHNTTEGNAVIMPPDMSSLAEQIVDAEWNNYLQDI